MREERRNQRVANGGQQTHAELFIRQQRLQLQQGQLIERQNHRGGPEDLGKAWRLRQRLRPHSSEGLDDVLRNLIGGAGRTTKDVAGDKIVAARGVQIDNSPPVLWMRE